MSKEIDIKNNVTKNIKAYFDNNPSMNNVKFAELLGTTEASVRAWKKGDYLPTLKLLPKVAEVMGISLSELLGLNENTLTNEQLSYRYKNDEKFKVIVDRISTDLVLKEALYTIVKNSK